MSIFAFTPARFAVLLAASVGVTLSTTDRPLVPKASPQSELSSPFRSAEAVGQDNGSLTSNLYLQAIDTPMPSMRGADRHGVIPSPQGPPPMLHHIYPPVAR